MMQALAFALSSIGFMALALAMNRHHRQMWQRNPTTAIRWIFRVGGVTALIMSLLACVQHVGWSVGTVLWIGLMTFAALLVALFFTYGSVHER